MRNYNTHHAPKPHLAFAHRRIIAQAYNANLRRPKKDRLSMTALADAPLVRHLANALLVGLEILILWTILRALVLLLPLVAPDRRVGRHPLSTTNCLTICADFGRFCRLLSLAIEKPAAKRCQEFFN